MTSILWPQDPFQAIPGYALVNRCNRPRVNWLFSTIVNLIPISVNIAGNAPNKEKIQQTKLNSAGIDTLIIFMR